MLLGPLRVGFLLMNDFTLSAFGDFIDVLRLAADEADHSRPVRCQWHLMSPATSPIRASCGLRVCPTSGLLNPDDLDYIVVVGGLLHRRMQVDVQTSAYLLRAARSSAKLTGICTGSFVLSRLGLLRGRKCCISWFHYQDFVEEFADPVPVTDSLYVIDEDRITCAGGAGVSFLAAHLVGRHLGPSAARKALHIQQFDRMKLCDGMELATPPAVLERDDRVSRTLLIMERHLSCPLSVVEIAAAVGSSPRQLERVFKQAAGVSPQEAYRQLRLKHARWLLRSPASLASIAAATGFADSGHFSKAFKTHYGVTPSQERQRIIHDSAEPRREGIDARTRLATTP